MSEMEGVTAVDATGPTPAKSSSSSGSGMHSKSGWDGKLRVDQGKKAVLANPEALEDPDYSDEDAPPVDDIEADEGGRSTIVLSRLLF